MARMSELRKSGTLLSNEFINILDEHFPDRMPEVAWSHDEIQQAIGRIQVIRTIKEWKQMLEKPDQYPEDENIFDFDKELN